MALQTSEGTLQKSLDRATELINSAFDVGYIKIESLRIHYNDPSLECILACYQSESKRQNSVNACKHYIIGMSITDSDVTSFSNADDRDTVYKMIEFIINYQELQKEYASISSDGEKSAFKESANAELDELASNLGIALSFRL